MADHVTDTFYEMYGRRMKIATHYTLTLEAFPKQEWGQWHLRFALYFGKYSLGEIKKLTVTDTQVIAELEPYTIAFNIGAEKK